MTLLRTAGEPTIEPSPPVRRSRYRASAAGWSAAICFALALLIAIPLMFTPVRLAHFADGPVVLSYAILGYSAFRLTVLFIAAKEALLEATFWIFVYIFFGLAAVAQTVTQQYALPPHGPFTEEHQLGALAVIIVGLLAYEAGRLISRGSPLAARAMLPTNFTLVPKRVWIVALVAFASTLAFVFAEGLGAQFSSRQDVTVSLLGSPSPGLRLDQISDKALGLIKIFFRWVPAFVALYLLLHLRTAVRWRAPWIRSTSATFLLVGLIVANLIVNNPVSNPRSRFGGVAIAFAIAVLPLRRPARFRIAVAFVVLGLLFLFPLADAFRYSERDFTVAPLAQDLVSSADYSMFQQELNAQVYVNTHGHTRGRQLVGSLFVFVPRRWWPDKPIATGDLISRTDVINASDSLWAEAYVDAGYIGVVGFFLLYGWLSHRYERAYMRRQPGSISAVSLFVPLFAAFQLLILRGALQPVVGELVPVALLVWACTTRRRARRGRR